MILKSGTLVRVKIENNWEKDIHYIAQLTRDISIDRLSNPNAIIDIQKSRKGL